VAVLTVASVRNEKKRAAHAIEPASVPSRGGCNTMNASLFRVHATALKATRYVANTTFERENEVMRKLMLAFGAAAMVAPTLVATTVDADAQRRYKYREWRGNDGRLRCRKSDGTTGLVVGAVAGGLLGRAVDTRGDRTLGTVLGGVGGALAGREIERSGKRQCR
jgi:hypothetical protein